MTSALDTADRIALAARRAEALEETVAEAREALEEIGEALESSKVAAAARALEDAGAIVEALRLELGDLASAVESATLRRIVGKLDRAVKLATSAREAFAPIAAGG